MKKVMLTNWQDIRLTPTDLAVTRQKPLPATPARATVRTIPTQVITNTYMQRKSYQSIYEDIFKLLMRLPDKALQQRVIDAINGSNNGSDKKSEIFGQCKQCLIKSERQVNTATQTTFTSTASDSGTDRIYGCFREETTSPLQNELKQEQTKTEAKGEPMEQPKDRKSIAKVPRKRGRRRNTCVPQVVKRSAAQMAMQEREDKQLTPLIKKKKVSPEPELLKDSSPSTPAMQRRDSIDSNISVNSTVMEAVENFLYNDNKMYIVKIMAKECFRAEQRSAEGLLPIHEAILQSDVCGLQRQVYVWSKLKGQVDFNSLLTADDEDCLELAVNSDSEPEIVRIILNAGVLPNHIYESNTVIHLAINNHIQLDSLRELMRKIDLSLLLQTNDDGNTALHIAVRHNQYKMAELICDVIDERELGHVMYKRSEEEETSTTSTTTSPKSGNSGQTADEKKFAKYYERVCDKLQPSKDGQRLKHKLLNAAEARGGNVALFFAIESELEHFCYFLLAHLSDPTEENHSGHSPKSFHYEYARTLRINLKIARVMDKVINILNG